MNDQFFELLDRWYASHQSGQPLMLRELAVDDSQLLRQLENYTESLTATAWLDHPLDDQPAANESLKSIPLTMGPYALLDRLGRGGMGEVYRARHTLMDREVAIKLLLPPRLAKSIDRDRFLREVRVLAKLEHANIVTAFDALEVDGHLALVTEFVAGHDAATALRTQGVFTATQVIDIGCQVALGLEHAHRAGIIHRDIKPSNVMLRPDGNVKILDLGIARLVTGRELDDSSLTGSRFTLGTPEYLPPEQFLDASAVDERADVYSLGATLFCLLTGEPPYGRGACGEVIIRHREAAIPRITDLRPDLDDQWNAFFSRCLAKQPSARFASMAAMDEALAKLPVHQVRHRLPRLTRRSILSGAIGTGALGVVAIGSYGLWNWLPSKSPAVVANFKISPPQAARDVSVQIGQGGWHDVRVIHRDPTNGSLQAVVRIDNLVTKLRFQHPDFPAAEIYYAIRMSELDAAFHVKVAFEHEGNALWRIHQAPGEECALIEYAAPGFEKWYLDIAPTPERASLRYAVLSPSGPPFLWKLDRLGDLTTLSSATLYDEYIHAAPLLGRQKQGEDLIPVLLAQLCDITQWRIHAFPNGLVAFECGVPEYAGHFLSCENLRPNVEHPVSVSILNRVVVKRLKLDM